MIDLSCSALEVAPQLVGAQLRHGEVVLAIVEVEAYLGPDDPASHAFRGPTPRSAVMFGEPGRLYVYLSYGMHLAANIVCSPEGTASAVLLRAARVVAGQQVVRQRRQARRGEGRALADHELARGPGCLGQALDLQLADSGQPIEQYRGLPPAEGFVAGFELWTADSGAVQPATGPRVGVSQAHDRPWRFWKPAEPAVSRYSRSPRAGLQQNSPGD